MKRFGTEEMMRKEMESQAKTRRGEGCKGKNSREKEGKREIMVGGRKRERV